MIIAGREIATRLIVMVVGAVILIVAVSVALSQCSSRKTAGKRAEVAEGQAGASVESGAEAVKTAAEVATSDDATDAQVAAAKATIAAAAKGQKGITAKREACKFKAYRDTPQCRELVQ